MDEAEPSDDADPADGSTETGSPDAADDASAAAVDRTDAVAAPSILARRAARVRRQAVALSERTQNEIEHRRQDLLPVDLAVLYYERDREALATVLGSATAMRLYLFLISTTILAVGIAIVVVGKDQLDHALSSASVTGTMAKDISDAASSSTGAGIALIFSGLWLVAWTGRNLTIVLAASAGRAWRIDAKEAKATVAAMASLTGLVIVLFTLSLLLNRLRTHRGFAAVTTSWVLTGVVFSVAWFAISWFLPRKTPDPGALLPGAAFIGIALALLQWFMQFYLPNKIDRTSDLAGQLGLTMAALGYLFFVGRLMATSFVIDAVVFERVGSLSRFIFSLPLIRAIPLRYSGVARFFDLPDAPPKPAKATSRHRWRRSKDPSPT